MILMHRLNLKSWRQSGADSWNLRRPTSSKCQELQSASLRVSGFGGLELGWSVVVPDWLEQKQKQYK